MTVVADTGYRTLTEACGLVDRSERGKLALTGSEAKDFLHGQVTNDIDGPYILSAGNIDENCAR